MNTSGGFMPNRNLSYPEFRATAWSPQKDKFGGTIGARSFDEWKAKENIPAQGNEVTVALSPNGAMKAVEDQKIKNVFELGTDQTYRSERYMENRVATEKSLLGLDENAAPDRRPVYGHIRKTGDTEAEGNVYGRVHLDVWPGKNHVTTTDGDSLNTLMENYGHAAPVPKDTFWKDTKFADLGAEHAAKDSGHDWDPDYREAQIHGGVPVDGSHIKRATVIDGGDLSNDKWMVQGLRARGVPTTVVKRWEQPSLITTDSISETTPKGRKIIDHENMPMTRGEHFYAGIPKDWENNRAPGWAYEPPVAVPRVRGGAR